MLFICYPKCSTCKKAEMWLINNNLQFEKRDIVNNKPSFDELKKWLDLSGLPIKRFFNTSGILYKELNLKEKLSSMSESEQLELLASNGMLVKRPLLVDGDKVFVGFREKEWETIL